MTAIFDVTDGSTTVSFYDSSGWGIAGWSPGYPKAGGETTELLQMMLRGTSHDNLASQIQSLTKLFRRASLYHNDTWQKTPVYIKTKADNETGSRYALIREGAIIPSLGTAEHIFDNKSWWAAVQIRIVRNPYWSSVIPETLPTAISLTNSEVPAAATIIPVGNVQMTDPITDIYAYDDSAAAFSGNLVAATGFNYFEVSGSTPAVNDYIMFGSAAPFFNVTMNIATAGVFTGVTFAVEHSVTGPAWSAPTDLAFTANFDQTDLMTLAFSNQDQNWVATAINALTRYWIRIRISAVTTWTTSPVQAAQIIYDTHTNYVEIANTVIGGDHPPLAMIRYLVNGVQAYDGIGFVTMGLKSNGLTKFNSMFHSGVTLPSGWTSSYETDTTLAASVGAPGDNVAYCTFTTDQTLITRWSFTATDADIEADFEGVYRVFLRCLQDSGSSGDASVALNIVRGAIVAADDPDGVTVTTGEEKVLKANYGIVEVIDMGRFEIMPTKIRVGEQKSAQGLTFDVLAASSNGATPNVTLHDIILIPIDEWSLVAEWQSGVGDLLSTEQGIQIDGGVLRQGVTKMVWDQGADVFSPRTYWATAGELPMIEPKRQSRIYFFSGAYDVTGGVSTAAPFGNIGLVEIRPALQWSQLRGTE